MTDGSPEFFEDLRATQDEKAVGEGFDVWFSARTEDAKELDLLFAAIERAGYNVVTKLHVYPLYRVDTSLPQIWHQFIRVRRATDAPLVIKRESSKTLSPAKQASSEPPRASPLIEY